MDVISRCDLCSDAISRCNIRSDAISDALDWSSVDCKRTEAPKKAFLMGNSHKTTRLEKQENYSAWLWYSSPVILKLPHNPRLQPPAPGSSHQKKRLQ
ncbi:hypothetical protein CMV_017907 [Castanea mollissima]|uniref:Uncharacterized protein n=1 Tax=Castanea mollissima TaxID=60419 RepID=A0A8J4QSB8_9ROSI|nr:hypothetical protein CMV_017907 [Castanea mollissima]